VTCCSRGVGFEGIGSGRIPRSDSVLETWTEYLEAPEPKVSSRVVDGEASAVKRAGMVEPDVVTDDLDFGFSSSRVGRLSCGIGKGAEAEIKVSKRWMTISSRRFCGGEHSAGAAREMFAQMPTAPLLGGAGSGLVAHRAVCARILRNCAWLASGQTIQLAQSQMGPRDVPARSDSAGRESQELNSAHFENVTAATGDRSRSALNPQLSAINSPSNWSWIPSRSTAARPTTFQGDSTY